MTNFDMVRDFHNAYNQEVKSTPEFPTNDITTLRYELISEELGEFQAAVTDKNLVEVADALTDLLYVVYGAGHAFGIDLDACFKEVHRSNMSKLDSNGKPIIRNDGKVMKGSNYIPPNLLNVLYK